MQSMLTEKEVAVISDLLTFEQAAFKKCKLYSRTITDPENSECLKRIAKNHKQRFDALFNLI